MAGWGQVPMGAITNRVTSGILLPFSVASRALPAILYGARIAASASIALYIAFFLQLDQPSWAGTTAVIVAQPAPSQERTQHAIAEKGRQA